MTLTAPKDKTKKRLFAFSGNKCYFPNCNTPLVDLKSETVIGEICHIKGKKPKSPRYDPNQSDEERHGFDNLILMCPLHHKVIDDNPDSYTISRLYEIKKRHEESNIKDEKRERFLDVELRKFGYTLIAKAFNKSERPIVVTHYRFLFPLYSIGSGLDVPYTDISIEESQDVFEMPPGILRDAIEKALEEIKSAPPPFRDLMIDSEINEYPIKLKDGESLSETLNIISFMDRIIRYYEERDFNTEVVNDLSNIKCCFYTNDGEFYSDTIEIESDIKEILKLKQEKNFTLGII
ncbi:MAG: hypothetical protein ACTSPD_09685 [Promethearchaeota archaeon]